ncbi:FAD-dependent oxidoreductase [Paenibacillus sp. GXUN7292]|uniref:FAD-dependent oxidoreductase n=1 Tax=Paenibacillus sp. GXUN7292 TaxID=3422499 RepID=UPI003D7C43F5
MIISHKINDQIVQTPFEDQSSHCYDVIVVGLGTAGAISAIVAAEKGLKVLAIDKLSSMGGSGTAGEVLSYYFGSRGGKFEEIDSKVTSYRSDLYTPSVGVNGEIKKYVMEQMALKAGVDIRYESSVTGMLLEGTKVLGIEYFNADGFHYPRSSVVIDCSGDSYACDLAGCELREGRSADGKPQPYSNVVVWHEKGRVRNFYTDSGYVNPSSAEDMSRAIVESAIVSTHLKETYTDEKRWLRVATMLGIREGRCIVSEDDITFKNFLDNSETDCPVFHAYSNLDTHSKDIALESEHVQDWLVASGLWSQKFSVPVPYGAFIPKGYDGILVAGRNIGVDHDIASHVRMKRDAQKCGEVAALASYLAIKNGSSIRDVSYVELLELLQDSSCYEEGSIISWLIDPAEIMEGLSGDKPGIAIWSARRLGEPIVNSLLNWVNTENENLRKHAAIALGLIGNSQALPVLRQIVRERDPYVPQTSHLYSQARGFAAIYLIGKLGDAQMISDLIDILENAIPYEYESNDRSLVYDDQDIHFQYFSYVWTALLRIGECHPDSRERIEIALHRVLGRSDLSLQFSLHGESGIKHSMQDSLRSIAQNYFESWNRN